MRATPIPDAEIWEGATRKVLTAPDGDPTNPHIAPVEALIDRSPSTGAVTLSSRCVLEDDDLAKLQAGGTIWLTFWSAMVPWSATVVGPVKQPACRWVDCQVEGDHEHASTYEWINPGDPTAGTVVVDVAEDGTVRLSEAAVAQLMAEAGWERAR